jgi:hypothetical protein
MLIPSSSLESIGLGAWGDASGDMAGSGPEEVPAGFWHMVARVGEGRAPPAPGEPCASFWLGSFGILVQFSQLEESGACPPLGTRCRLEHSLQKSPG